MSTTDGSQTADQPIVYAWASYKGYVRVEIGESKFGMTPSLALKLAADLTEAVSQLGVVDDSKC